MRMQRKGIQELSLEELLDLAPEERLQHGITQSRVIRKMVLLHEGERHEISPELLRELENLAIHIEAKEIVGDEHGSGGPGFFCIKPEDHKYLAEIDILPGNLPEVFVTEYFPIAA